MRRNRFLDLFIVMATELRIDEGLDGAFNFSLWKARIVLILQENELWEIVNNIVAHHVNITIVEADKVAFDKLDNK